MMFLYSILLVVISIFTVKGNLIARWELNKFLPKVMNAASACAPVASKGVTPEFCILQWDEINDPKDAKFNDCRDTMTCAVKKLGYMSDDGLWLLPEAEDIKEKIANEDLKNEFQDLYSKCSTVEGKNGEAFVNMMVCLMNNSEKFRDNVREVVQTLKYSDYGGGF